MEEKDFDMIAEYGKKTIKEIMKLDFFYDFDSRLDHPKIFKTLEELQKRLNYIKKNDGFIFLIYKM